MEPPASVFPRAPQRAQPKRTRFTLDGVVGEDFGIAGGGGGGGKGRVIGSRAGPYWSPKLRLLYRIRTWAEIIFSFRPFLPMTAFWIVVEIDGRLWDGQIAAS